MKRAQLVAEAVAVLCPICGETQPNREGSEMWTHEDFAPLRCRQSNVFTCVSCDVTFLLTCDTKVMFR